MQQPTGVIQMSPVPDAKTISPKPCEKSILFCRDTLLSKIVYSHIPRPPMGQPITFLAPTDDQFQLKTDIHYPYSSAFQHEKTAKIWLNRHSRAQRLRSSSVILQLRSRMTLIRNPWQRILGWCPDKIRIFAQIRLTTHHMMSILQVLDKIMVDDYNLSWRKYGTNSYAL